MALGSAKQRQAAPSSAGLWALGPKALEGTSAARRLLS